MKSEIEPAKRRCRKKKEYINLHCEEMRRIRRHSLVVPFIRLPSACWSDADPALNPRATPVPQLRMPPTDKYDRLYRELFGTAENCRAEVNR